MMTIDEIESELESAPVYLENERDLYLFDALIGIDIATIAKRENEVHEIIGILLESFQGNMYFRSKKKSESRERRLKEIAGSNLVRLPEEFLYYVDETSFSTDGHFKF